MLSHLLALPAAAVRARTSHISLSPAAVAAVVIKKGMLVVDAVVALSLSLMLSHLLALPLSGRHRRCHN